MNKVFRILAVLSALIATTTRSYGSHLFGADLYYTWVSGYTYTVTLVVYGDCSGTAFPSLSSSSPEVQVFNGSTLYGTYNLTLQAPTAGVEVTPVCDADKNNTTCNGGTVPGIKKFVYSKSITLSGTSSAWVFLFDGTMSGVTSAGRSNSITNISISATSGSVMQLRDTLNNMGGPNSSPQYTTIPTPFFCNNKSANYNPGAVDPNSDSLVFQLVPGLEPGGTVTYLAGYSATSPLAVTSGTFSFSSTTGQMSFTPNALQKSLVVGQVEEYRNDTLVGTSMREMTFVVLSCSNAPPSGKISSASAGTVIDSTHFKICQSAGSFTFHIDPTDRDSNNITVSVAGLASGATYTISNNGTKTPTGLFSWNVSTVTPGTYTFYITYLDDACPLSSKQTQAYSITVLANPTLTYNLISAATCTKKAVFTVTSTVSGGWTTKIYQGTTLKDSIYSTTGTITDSMSAGTYTIRTYNSNNCYKDTSITIADPATTKANVTLTNPICNHYNNGAISVTGYNSTGPYEYALGSGTYSSSGTFTSLYSGTYTVHIKNSVGCIKDTTVKLIDSLKVSAAIALNNITCHGDSTGTIVANGSGGYGWPYTYALNSGSFGSSGTFLNLPANTYIVHVQDTALCYFDTSITLTQPALIVPVHTIVNVDCYGNATGKIIEAVSGGVAAYQYSDDGITFSTSNTFTGLTAGTYVITIDDANNCLKHDTVTVTQPAPLGISAISFTEPNCYDSSNGSYTITATGGTTPYQYAIDAKSFATISTITGIAAGTHTLHIKDTHGCTKDTTITLVQPDPITIGALVKQSTCKTLSDGKVTLLASGGTPGYTYSKDGTTYSAVSTFTPLGASAYTFYVKDIHGCIKDTAIAIKDSLYITGLFKVRNVSCFGQRNGAIDVTPTGGVDPYQVALDTQAFNNIDTFGGFPAGTYMIHIKDAIGCTNDTNINITQPDAITIHTTVTPNDCEGLDNGGAVIASVAGGTRPYQYTWNTNITVTDSFIHNMPNGDYIVWVTDNNSCTDSAITAVKYDDCCKPFVPSGFTPNGDGKNDLFRPLYKGDMTLVFFGVFNRFGTRVFYTTKLGEGWDGNWNNVPQEVGGYYWYLKVICGNKGDHVVEMKGDVTLIR